MLEHTCFSLFLNFLSFFFSFSLSFFLPSSLLFPLQDHIYFPSNIFSLHFFSHLPALSLSHVSIQVLFTSYKCLSHTLGVPLKFITVRHWKSAENSLHYQPDLLPHHWLIGSGPNNNNEKSFGYICFPENNNFIIVSL